MKMAALAATATAAVACYLNGLHGDWLDDDPVAITQNEDVVCHHGIRGLFDNISPLLAHDFWGTPLSSDLSHLSYRPLTTLTFRLQHCLVGFDRFAFHACNAALHAAVCALASSTVCSVPAVMPRRSQQSFAMLLFALHAVHVEAVTNTVGRAELLSAIFFFAALHVYRPLLPASPSPTRASSVLLASSSLRMICVLALTGTSMLCKEVGLTAILVCAAWDIVVTMQLLAVRGRGARSNHVLALTALRVLCLGLGGVGLLSVRLAINGWRSPQFSGHDNAAAFCEDRLCRVLSYSHLYWLNIRLLLWPTNLAHDWSMTTVPNVHSFLDARTPLVMAPYLIVAALVVAVTLALRRGSPRFNGLALGTAVLIAPFLPASGAFVTAGFTVAERVLYLPSCGFCMLLSIPLARPARGRGLRCLMRCATLALFVVHGVLTARRNVDWRTNISLLEAGVRHQPTNCKLRYNLGYTLHALGSPSRREEAVHHLQAARRLLPSMHEAACIEAAVLRETRRIAEAEHLLRGTQRLAMADTGKRSPHDDTGMGYQSYQDDAIRASNQQHLEQLNRQGLYFASKGLGDMLEAEGRPAEALAAFLPALQVAPQDVGLVRQSVRVAAKVGDQRASALLAQHAERMNIPLEGVPNAPTANPRTHAEEQMSAHVNQKRPSRPSGSSSWGARLAARNKR